MTGENFMRIERGSDIKRLKEKIYSLKNKCGDMVKERLGDIEVEVIPINLTTKNAAVLKLTFYEDDISDSGIKFEEQEVGNGPGYHQRLLQTLVSIFTPVLGKYPQIMKDFNPGATIEE